MSGIQHDPFKPKTIKVPCMRCGKPTPVDVPYDFKGTIRKFCSSCNNNIDRMSSAFDPVINSDGCRRK